MSTNNFIKILIAEDNEVSRNMMAGILETQGYQILHAADGEEAIQIIDREDVDLALIDLNMAPKGGFEFAKYLLTKGLKIPMVVVTADESSDVLSVASSLGIQRVLNKPVGPDRLLGIVRQILKRHGLNPDPMGVGEYNASKTPEDLMKQVIDMAQRNVDSRKGGPFAAIVTDTEGKVLGSGTNSTASRVDPVAHAEVMAIRQAAEKLGKTDLSECILYCTSAPTEMGRALIRSVGLPKVYFALEATDLKSVQEKPQDASYERLMSEEAKTVLKKDA